MATYTEAYLKALSQSQKAIPGKDYVVITGPDKGSLYRGNRNKTLDFITDNFDILAQNAVGSILTDTSSANSVYEPGTDEEEAEIDVSVNQMNLGDVLAFAAAN